MTREQKRRSHGGTASLAAGAFFGHVIYPVMVQVLSRTVAARPEARPTRMREGRYVSAVVPAYREVATIGVLVRQLLDDPASPVGEVVVVADDDVETAAVAHAAGAVVVAGAGRGGKADAVNRGIAACSNEVVLLLDANVTVEAQALRRLADHVDAGRLDVAGGIRTEHGHAGESLYWAFENATKAAEQRLGGSLALVGELMALRRSTFRPIPTWVTVDDVFVAVDHASRGLRVGVDTSCRTAEASVRPREQLERRLRVMSALLELMARRPRMFLPTSVSIVLLHGHRTWRSTAGPACQLALFLRALRAARRSPLAAGWVLVNVAAVGDYLGSAMADSTPPGRIRPLAGQALGMPPVILAGALVRLLRRARSGGSDGTWARVER